MRVIFANRYFYPDQSATSRVVSSVAFGLARRGFDVTVVSSREIHNQRDVVLPAKEIVGGVTIRRLSTTRFGRHSLLGRGVDYLFFHALAFFWMICNISFDDIAVICTDPPLLSVTSGLALRWKNAVMVNWIMDLFPEAAIELGYFARFKKTARLMLVLRDWSLRSRGLCICPTDTMAEYITRRGFRKDHVIVSHHWSDGEEIRPVERAQNSLRRKWGIESAFVVGYSGNFGRAHEFETMLGAAERLKADENIRFLMIGGGHHLSAVTAKARTDDLRNILFRPLQPIENLSESLGAADVHLVSLLPLLEHCVIPSKFYGILAAGRATIFIGDPKGEVARVIQKTGCGLHVDLGDMDGLTRAIRYLRDNPAICRSMGARARQLLTSEYSRDGAIDAWCRIITSIAALDLPSRHVSRGVSP
ncbi:glycosyltransferase family 4 protein [Rhizobium sp. NFR12]|uniref:glycosyltransferase family 4 protein n=1 Tax=Rhizobium sp. NFR12 TaxID=1566261 RepID=UPI0008A73E61|nr:glycosyltransferase family 4 protein [Rhizobium sp. NFR12]SEH27402.1 Glycosyltransferase involved in cell wall bisynthesis [Rhizobium sp. NFR12]